MLWSLFAPAVTGPLVLLEPALVVFEEAVDDDEAAIPVVCEKELELAEAELVADGVELGDGPELADDAKVLAALEPLVPDVAELSVVSEDVVDSEVDEVEAEETDDEGDELMLVLTLLALALLLTLLATVEEVDTAEDSLDEDVEDVGMIADTDVPVCCAEVTICADEDRSAAAEVLVEGEMVLDWSQKSMYCWNWPSRYVRVVSLPDEPLSSIHVLQPS